MGPHLMEEVQERPLLSHTPLGFIFCSLIMVCKIVSFGLTILVPFCVNILLSFPRIIAHNYLGSQLFLEFQSVTSSSRFFFHWLYSPRGPWSLISLLIYSQLVGLLGRVISPSQGRYLNTEQHKHRINTYTTH
jgi:hypothetical protein